MKPIILFGFFLYCLGAFSQSNSDKYPTEYIKTLSNTYEVIHFTDFNSVANAINPFNNLENEHQWQDKYRVINSQGDIYKTLITYMKPYLQNITVEDDDFIHLGFWHDLNGELSFIRFDYPNYLNIPIEVIERLETALKSTIKLKLTPKGKEISGVFYLQFPAFFSLKSLQEEAFPPPPPIVPPAPINPTWDGDLAIQLGEFAPSYNYGTDTSFYRYKYLYPDMFNFTDECGNYDANIYISGIGKAALTFSINNQTNHDIVLNLSKISVRLDKDGQTIIPEISYIYTFNGRMNIPIKNETITISSQGGNITLEFVFDDILKGSIWDEQTYDCKMYFLYENRYMMSHVIDERYDYTWENTITATWYKKGYIMLRYMYNTREQEKYYDTKSNQYFR